MLLIAQFNVLVQSASRATEATMMEKNSRLLWTTLDLRRKLARLMLPNVAIAAADVVDEAQLARPECHDPIGTPSTAAQRQVVDRSKTTKSLPTTSLHLAWAAVAAAEAHHEVVAAREGVVHREVQREVQREALDEARRGLAKANAGHRTWRPFARLQQRLCFLGFLVGCRRLENCLKPVVMRHS